MVRKALGVTVALVAASVIPAVVAQSRRAPPPAFEQASRAMLEGRYDEVPGLVEKLDAQAPAVAALIARANIARGRYQQAETVLRPAAQRAPTSEAALELGLLLKMLGREEATSILTRVASLVEVATNAADMARGARALRALGRFYEANAAYREAATAAPRDPAINTAWGDLFLEKYDKAEALKSYQAALKVDPRWVPALLGAARALAGEDSPQALKIVAQVLEVNPSSVDVHVFLAGEAADAGRRDEARKSLKKALEINPASLEAHALLGALAFTEDKPAEFEAEMAAVLALAPNYGEAYRVAGNLASHNFRYDDAATLTRRGLALDPQNPAILSDLGIHLLRTGEEAEAREVLERSFKLDGFNKVTYNLLQMMDTLDTFVTARDRDVILRLDKTEAPVLGEYAMALAHQALDTLAKRYEFTPKGPILVEIFPKHDHFAVRTAGLPGMIGALGVCFGRVVAMDSPRAQPGSFQWEATLWHELAHVVTLQMSNHRVPRWLTEGISVYEEKLQRADWGRGMDMTFAAMLNRGETLKLRDLNAAFTDPRKILLAYFQASLVVDHIVRTYGDAGLHKLLRAYAQGLDTDAALKTALGTDFDQMQVAFDRTIEESFGKLRAALETPDKEKEAELAKMPLDALKTYAGERPGNYPAQLMLGSALREAGEIDQALAAFERAAALAPMAVGRNSPNAQIAEISIERKDTARAIAALQALVAADFDNVEVARQLAALLRDNKITDPARLHPVYERIVAIDPFDADAHAVLGRLLMQMNQADAAVREFKAVVALGPVDQAAAYTDLAEGYYRSGKRAEARKQTLAALEVAPSYERAQNLLLELAAGRP